MLLHEDQFNLTESEKKALQEKEHILIRSCFYANKTEYLERIHPLLQQYTSQEDSLLFLLRIAYEVDQHSYFSDYTTIALSSFPSSRNIVLSLVLSFDSFIRNRIISIILKEMKLIKLFILY